MVALLTSVRVWSSASTVRCSSACSWLLTRGIVLCEDESARGAVQLRAGVEDELVRWLAGVGHRAGHVMGWAVDDEVAEEILALPESAVVRL